MNPTGETVRRYRTRLKPLWKVSQCLAILDLFLLLLFFILLSSSVVRISGIRVDLPQANAPQESVLGKLVVTVTPGEDENSCRYYFRDREIKLDELQSIFSREKERHKKTVIIRSDRKVPMGALHELIAEINGAGMPVLIAVQTPDSKPEIRFE